MAFMISRETENVKSSEEIESAFRALSSEGKPYVTKEELYQVWSCFWGGPTRGDRSKEAASHRVHLQDPPGWLSRGFQVGWEVVVLENSQLACAWAQV